MARRRLVSADERRLWFAAMHGTQPLPGREIPPEPPPVAPVIPTPAVSAATPPTPRRPSSAAAETTTQQARDIDRRTADRFRRGRMELDVRIDLHGMTQAQAHGVLLAFVHRAWTENRRCVLVITGKGGFAGDGVLRRAAPRWLAEPAPARMILAVQPARPKDGGDGAFYVLIRRRREPRR